nr:MAG TPA: hypothetical protein [Caudoviricetes sp.]
MPTGVTDELSKKIQKNKRAIGRPTHGLFASLVKGHAKQKKTAWRYVSIPNRSVCGSF